MHGIGQCKRMYAVNLIEINMLQYGAYIFLMLALLDSMMLL